MPGFVGLPELILFGIVALLIFGPKKLPEMGRSLGKGLREFKDSVSSSGSTGDTPVVHELEAADDAPNPFEAAVPAERTTRVSS